MFGEKAPAAKNRWLFGQEILNSKFPYTSDQKILNSKFPYTSGQKSCFFNVILAHVLILKHHLSIQNMLWDHPQGGKLHEESFFNSPRALRTLFWWVFDDSFKIFKIFKKYFRKVEKRKFPKIIPISKHSKNTFVMPKHVLFENSENSKFSSF